MYSIFYVPVRLARGCSAAESTDIKEGFKFLMAPGLPELPDASVNLGLKHRLFYLNAVFSGWSTVTRVSVALDVSDGLLFSVIVYE